jgi:hypothetical protein
MGSLAALWLSACGGGSSEVEPASDAGEIVAGSDATPAPPVNANPGLTKPGAVDGRALPAGAAGAQLLQYLVWDGGDGPNKASWSQHLQLAWKHSGVGDWIDAQGVSQGGSAFSAAPVLAQQTWVEFDVSSIVAKFVASGENKGFTLRTADRAGAKFAGRLSANPPQLVVDGQPMSLQAFACYAAEVNGGIDSRLQVAVQATMTGIVQFDLRAVAGVSSATLRLYCERRYSSTPTIEVYECDAPRVVVGAAEGPRVGIAMQAGSELALKAHPAVLRAGDFSDIVPTNQGGTVFDSVAFEAGADGVPRVVQMPDPDFPGSTMLRGRFEAGAWDEGAKRSSCSFQTEHMRADESDPRRPPAVIEEEMFARLYIFLEDDWNSVRDANKLAIGWDLRMGWWNPAQRGYWQSVTGNGGAPGDGRRRVVGARSPGLSSSEQYEYWGHSIRMEAGRGSTTGNPYGALRPLQSYVYNLDQPTAYGSMFRLGSACIRKGQWFCLEQQIKMNSIVGPLDAQGNGEAVADGVMRTWVDGVLASEITNLRWRRHPQMGIQGPWINWFYGGKQPSEVEMHYRMNHFAVARQYIGPRAT